jgi:MFS family permease
LVACCIASAGVGIGYAAMPTLVLDAVPPREAASAVGVNALMRSMGTTLAAAAMGTVLSGSSTTIAGHAIPSEGAFHACFLIGAAAAFVGVAITAAIPRRVTGSGLVVDPVDGVVEGAQAGNHVPSALRP